VFFGGIVVTVSCDLSFVVWMFVGCSCCDAWLLMALILGWCHWDILMFVLLLLLDVYTVAVASV